MPRELTPEEKRKFISLKYFGTADNPTDDVNPFDSVTEFLMALVGDLDWGIASDVRRRSKIRFSFNFHRVLAIYRVELFPEEIMETVDDDSF